MFFEYIKVLRKMNLNNNSIQTKIGLQPTKDNQDNSEYFENLRMTQYNFVYFEFLFKLHTVFLTKNSFKISENHRPDFLLDFE